MQDAITAGRCLARLAKLTDWSLLVQLWPVALQMARLVAGFRDDALCPRHMLDFEWQLKQLLDKIGRLIVQWRLNCLEPQSRIDVPPVLFSELDAYRPKRLSRMRNLNCLFGPIRVNRWLYEPLDGLVLPALFPLEQYLGIIAGVATPALADLVARLSVDLTQRQVLETLRQQQHVVWGASTLRNVTKAMAEGIAPYQHVARVQMLLGWLKEAAQSCGPVRFTLAVGRDGLMLPIRGKETYKEGATATVSVLDRWGKRLGTIYLGQMPESGQGTLSDELTRLLRDVLAQWQGTMPRLVYITDAGFHPRDYFENVLSRMLDPKRTGRYLEWEWTVDYYHACCYVSKVAEAIFGPGREAHAWAAKMRRWLKNKPGGIHRVLRSAGALRAIRGLVGEDKDYHDAYAFLRKHARWMDFAGRRRRKLPIGSGVTEAACKIVFSQRFKCSGMKWDITGGAVILELRVAVLSRTWTTVRDAMFASQAPTLPGTHRPLYSLPIANAA
jgi:hypothetical protein